MKTHLHQHFEVKQKNKVVQASAIKQQKIYIINI